MNATLPLMESRAWYGVGVWPNVVFYSAFVLIQIACYALYRIAAYYCKWKLEKKTFLDMFQDNVKMVVLTFLYIYAGNYFEMFSCKVEQMILEYLIPFLLTMFILGFCCEYAFFKVRLIEMRMWGIPTWLGFGVVTIILIFLIIMTFVRCNNKEYFFLPLIPCVFYFLLAFILSLCPLTPRLRFHPHAYQIIYVFCLLRKENDFYSRLFAGLITGAFLRVVSANAMTSILEVVEEGPILVGTPGLEGAEAVERTSEVSIALSDKDTPLLSAQSQDNPEETFTQELSTINEEETEAYLKTIEKYNKGVVEKNRTILERDEEVDAATLHCSRASDYSDWNESQKRDLLGEANE